ncbi:MAG: acyloxyacyl hydrolase [Cellulophaga sp.]
MQEKYPFRKVYILYVVLFFSKIISGQNPVNSKGDYIFISPEILVGQTFSSNKNFPKTKMQKAFFLSIGKHHLSDTKEWAIRLNQPKTGLLFGITDFGNSKSIGKSYTIMPFMEFNLPQKLENWYLQMAFGGAYFDTKYHKETNPFNQGITTEFNWAYKAFIYYNFAKKNTHNWRLGLGLMHYSNGHTALPNQGLNSLLLSVSSNIKTKTTSIKPTNNLKKENTKETFFTFRSGIGQNVLAKYINDRKEVYTIAFSGGKIINKTFKIGIGAYYRFYEHYNDYIKNDTDLMKKESPKLKNNPYRNATNFGIFATSELLLNHIGFEFDIGVNLHKPFYKIDWHLNEGYPSNKTVDGVRTPTHVLGELGWYYKTKRTVSTRLGLKYYLISTHKSPINNIFIAAHINANLGQADFSEVSLGYTYRVK